MLITHVDDLCWAMKPGYEKPIQEILDAFVVKKVEETKFRFCGKDIEQLDDMSIRVSCEDAIEGVGVLKYERSKRKPEDNAKEAEIGQMRSIIGSLGWIARQCHPEISYGVSKMQGAVSKAKMKDLKETNQILETAQEYKSERLLFQSDAICWTDAIVVTITDASFAQETVIETDGNEKPHRTQKAYMILLCSPDILDNDSAGCHIWAWRSLTDKRVCRATLQGEAHGMLSGTEMGDRLRAIIADCCGQIGDMRNWQEDSAKFMRHIWMSDCESLVSHLKNPKNERLENVRLSIDIQGLKTMLWEKADGTPLDDLMPEATCENAVRWIDTRCMIVDCLTKRMDPKVLVRLMRTGTVNLQPTVESELAKLRKQKNRKAKKLAEQECTESIGYMSLSRYIQERYDCGNNDTWNSSRRLRYALPKSLVPQDGRAGMICDLSS